MTPIVSFNKNKLNQLMGRRKNEMSNYIRVTYVFVTMTIKVAGIHLVVGYLQATFRRWSGFRTKTKKRRKSKRYERISRNGTRKMRHVGDPERCSIESWTLIVCSCSTEMKNTSTREKKIVLHDWMFGWVHEICLGERLLSFHRAVALFTTLFYYYFYITFSVRQTSELSQPHRRRTKKKQKKKTFWRKASYVCRLVFSV